MKKYASIIILSILVLLLPACSEKVLNQTPLDQYSDGSVWADVDLSGAYLNTLYSNVKAWFGGTMPTCLSDETVASRGNASETYVAGMMTPVNQGSDRGHITWKNWPAIQSINLFLDNIDKVPEAYQGTQKPIIKARTDVMKGEALFLRAWYYTGLCRSYGGVPIFSKANAMGDNFSGITRATFKETVNFIVKNCDDAAQLLKFKSATEMGRASKEAALSLKSRILLFAASDLTADGTAANELVGYISPDRTALWTAARNAAKAVIDLGTCNLTNVGAPDRALVAKNYFGLFKAYDLSNKEVIWGKMFVVSGLGVTHIINRDNGPNGNHCYGRSGPLQRMVDEYEMIDGSKFLDHFTVNASKQYKNISAKFKHESPYLDREPRFYANVLYDSAVWQPRFPDLAARDPLGIYDRRTRIVKSGSTTISTTPGLDTRSGPVEANNANYVGYLTKKFMDDQCIAYTVTYNQNIRIFIRYAEVILNYAEACAALGDIATATDYINMIRNRVALPNFTGDITQALRHERKIELFGEESRWFDIRRWKILEEALTPPNYGITIVETNDGGVRTTNWTQVVAQPQSVPNKKMYWIPIDAVEIAKAPQIIQNPLY